MNYSLILIKLNFNNIIINHEIDFAIKAYFLTQKLSPDVFLSDLLAKEEDKSFYKTEKQKQYANNVVPKDPPNTEQQKPTHLARLKNDRKKHAANNELGAGC